jgi:hypothetical protein
VVEFGPEVDAVVRSMADSNGSLVLKSQSYSTSSMLLVAGSSGSVELSFNQRLSSIKSIFALFTATNDATVGTAGKYGAKDITKSAGSYTFYIGSEPYPQRGLDTTNKAGMYMELAQAWNNASSVDACNMAITPIEYNRIDGTSDSAQLPGKFYIGCNTERLHSSVLLSGVSSQLSPITLRAIIPTTTTNAHNATLVTVHDSLIDVNVVTRQCTVKQ